MFIGQAAKKSGLTIKSIRFYEEKGLIQPSRSKGTYRVYTQSDLELLILIKEARAMGISIAHLKQVIVDSEGNINWLEIKGFLAEMRLVLMQQLDDLTRKVVLLDECYAQIDDSFS